MLQILRQPTNCFLPFTEFITASVPGTRKVYHGALRHVVLSWSALLWFIHAERFVQILSVAGNRLEELPQGEQVPFEKAGACEGSSGSQRECLGVGKVGVT